MSKALSSTKIDLLEKLFEESISLKNCRKKTWEGNHYNMFSKNLINPIPDLKKENEE